MYAIIDALAIWKPAIQVDKLKVNDLKVNDLSVTIRTALAACASFMILSLLPMRLRLPPMTSGLVVTILKVWPSIEHNRATAVLNRIAIQQWFNNKVVPNRIMDYIKREPSAVRKLISSQADLTKFNTVNQTLLQSIIFSARHFNTYEENQKILESFKAFIDGKVALNNRDVLAILQLESDKLDFILYALEKGKIDLSRLIPEDKFKFWICVKNKRMAQLLIKCGLDINAKDEENKTLLLRIMERQWSNRVNYDGIDLNFTQSLGALLENGAELPSSDEKMHRQVKENGETITQDITVEQFLHEQPVIDLAFQQARDFKKQGLQLPLDQEDDYAFNVKQVLNLKKPAINIRFFKVNSEQIFVRTMLVALPILTLFSLIPAIALASSLASSFCLFAIPFIAVPLYYRFEWSRATRALNERAMQEFQTMFPSKQVIDYAIIQESLINELINNQFNFNKMDEDCRTWGQALFQAENWNFDWKKLSPQVQLSIFKKITDQMFKQESFSLEQKYAYFLGAIQCGRIDYMHYLLENKKIRVVDLTPAQQVNCWQALSNEEIALVNRAQLLQDYGFNPNIEDDKGRIPLLCGRFFNNYNYVKALVNVDANPDIPIKNIKQDKVKTARIHYEQVQNWAILSLFPSQSLI